MADPFYKDATARNVAKWMTEEFRSNDQINQKDAVDRIRSLFGEHFVTETDKDGWSINQAVRDEFQRLNPEAIYVFWGWKRYDPVVDTLTETLAVRLVNAHARLKSANLKLVKAAKGKEKQHGKYYLVKADGVLYRPDVDLTLLCRKLELLTWSGEVKKRGAH